MKTNYHWLLSSLLIITSFSCAKMNDLHDQYLKNGEIIYTGRVDSARVFAGENRVMLRYYISDPKAKNLLIYWNLRTEFREFTIPDKNPEDPVDVYIEDLDEGSFYFEVFSLNENMQNKSVLYSTEGNVYGSIFQSSLLNRKIISASRKGPDQPVVIEWDNADPLSIGCQIRYTNQEGVTVYLTVPVEDSETIITDVSNEAENIECQTMYLPEPDAIDIFYTAFRQVEIIDKPLVFVDITAQVLKNTAYPFTPSDHVFNNRLYLVQDWITNPDGAANGNYDNNAANIGRLGLWSAASFAAPSITNAKLYQTVELEAGSYRFDVLVYLTSNIDFNAYIAAGLGHDLPDIDVLDQDALDYISIPGYIARGTDSLFSIAFVLSEKSAVSLGFVATTPATGTTQIMFSKVELWMEN